jgi:uncharacterized coiled-coil protein SlyX
MAGAKEIVAHQQGEFTIVNSKIEFDTMGIKFKIICDVKEEFPKVLVDDEDGISYMWQTMHFERIKGYEAKTLKKYLELCKKNGYPLEVAKGQNIEDNLNSNYVRFVIKDLYGEMNDYVMIFNPTPMNKLDVYRVDVARIARRVTALEASNAVKDKKIEELTAEGKANKEMIEKLTDGVNKMKERFSRIEAKFDVVKVDEEEKSN